jgi:Fe-Mn family superoxide dismutase
VPFCSDGSTLPAEVPALPPPCLPVSTPTFSPLMITRRVALQSLALSTGALALGSASSLGQSPATTPPEVHKLPPLGYDYDALEPFIDTETMKLHHDKHHAAYVAKLNQALEKEPSQATRPLEDLLRQLSSVPETIRNDVRNHGGGHFNHTLFWQCLRKKNGDAPSGELAKALEKSFSSLTGFEEQLQAAAMKVFGSGWTWLVLRDKKLVIESTPNQDSPLSTGGIPILGLDVWEHAYYLKYQNRRVEYLKALMQVIHWDFVSERFRKAAI